MDKKAEDDDLLNPLFGMSNASEEEYLAVPFSTAREDMCAGVVAKAAARGVYT